MELWTHAADSLHYERTSLHRAYTEVPDDTEMEVIWRNDHDASSISIVGSQPTVNRKRVRSTATVRSPLPRSTLLRVHAEASSTTGMQLGPSQPSLEDDFLSQTLAAVVVLTLQTFTQ